MVRRVILSVLVSGCTTTPDVTRKARWDAYVTCRHEYRMYHPEVVWRDGAPIGEWCRAWAEAVVR